MAISVIIGTCNSARHIGRVLESVKMFDEVVVCDLESSDETLDIAKSYGAKIVHIAALGEPGVQKIRDYVLTNATNKWVLMLSPDEIVTPHLRKFLYEFTENPDGDKGVYIPRKNYVLNRLRDHSYPDYQLRFFDRENTTWSHDKDADPHVNGNILKIPASRGELALIKLPKSLSALLAVVNRKSTEELNGIAGEYPQVTVMGMFWKPVFRFSKEYFLKGKFMYGIEGFITSVNRALEIYCMMAKIHEDKVMGEFNRALDRVIAGEEEPLKPRIKRLSAK